MTERTIAGRRPEETIGRPLTFTGSRTRDVVMDTTAQAVGGELVCGTETQSPGDSSPFQAAAATIRDGGEQVSALRITVTDICDQEHLEAEVRLSQKLEAVGRLAGGVAHDFNNLLTVINGYGGMLLDSVKGNPDAAMQAEGILSAANRAAELVSQLLTYSRRQVINVRPIAVEQLVNGIERMLRRVLCEHIEFRTKLDPAAGWIKADLNQMESVLLNMATNAQDAMPQGGLLSIETARVDVTPNCPSPQPGLPVGPYVLLVVSDTGGGMDAETQRQIFEPFFTTKQPGEGTGLGLWSVSRSVEQSGGRVFVTSQLGRGTKFSIYLPCISPVPAHDKPRMGPNVFRGRGGGIILLVEDDGVVRRMMGELLRKAGYTVWEAGNGAEAIAQWAGKIGEVDLLMTDIIMPVMNGLKLAEELRNRRGDLQVLYLSGHSDQVIERQIGPAPAPDVLQKPFVPDRLIQKVREVLRTST
jgi:two-component system cell cycle sensor histidine kinase/response regulator CckA